MLNNLSEEEIKSRTRCRERYIGNLRFREENKKW